MKKVSLILCGLIMLPIFIFAQHNEQTTTDDTVKETKNFPAQFSVFYPSFATHGERSTDYTFNFSLNLLYGKIGGLNGVEISGLVGRVVDDVNGVQIACFGNGAANVSGIQIGGLGNRAADVSGIQISALGNSAANVHGLQIGGLGNGAANVNGLQIGCMYNRTEKLNGLQIGLVSVNDTVKKDFLLAS